MNLQKVSTLMCYILRHHPEKFGITLDENGYCDADELLNVLRNQAYRITKDQLNEIVYSDDKGRYGYDGKRIAALYGHSCMKIEKKNTTPPEKLYHGTTKEAYEKIMQTSIKHMGRKYVNLSLDIETATKVALRRTDKPIIIEVDALKAFNDGIHFYNETKVIWSCDDIPCKYLKLHVEEQ